MESLKRPSSLKRGDLIAIASPAGAVDSRLFAPAISWLEDRGYRVELMPHAKGRVKSYSGIPVDRIDDLKDAFLDPEIKAILCGRGGYGTVQILNELANIPIEDNPKWLIGFSDITALHGLMHSKGIMSMHAQMVKGLAYAAENPDNQKAAEALFYLLEGGTATYQLPSYPLNKEKDAQGIILGGNLAVMESLVGTPFDLIQPDTVLFIEDIGEPLYKIERMLLHMRLRGLLPKLRALIVGRFTSIPESFDCGYDSVEELVSSVTHDYDFPVYFNAPIGHFPGNMPIIEGKHCYIRDNALIF